MNIFDMITGKIPGKKQQEQPRLVSRPRDYLLPAIAAGATFVFSVQSHTPDMRQYLPLNWFEFYNPSTSAFSVRLESPAGEMFLVAADSSRIVRSYFNNIIIVNTSANNLAANTACITLQKV
jgi:hypothetical protein